MPEENPKSGPNIGDSPPAYLSQIAVRSLVEWALRQGNLGGSRRFMGPSRALQGTREHQRVQDSRPAEYLREVPVKRVERIGEVEVTVSGRIDGLWPRESGWLLEEIKTVTPDWDGQARPLHWAQVRIYGFLIALEKDLETLDLQLTYVQLESGELTVFRESAARLELQRFYEQVWAPMSTRLKREIDWRHTRNTSLRSIPFPFPERRQGQSAMIEAVEDAIAGRQRLFVEAPTGIGKTISALFAASLALGKGSMERVIYLTAKTSGRALAEEACQRLRDSGARLKSLTLNAASAVCFTEAPRCDLRDCPYALGYYDRFRQAIDDALEIDIWNRHSLEKIGKERQVCPFALSRDLIDFADVVIADYNHAFDPTSTASGLVGLESRRPYTLLVDEAHNLVDRSRTMFSSLLREALLSATAQKAKGSLPRIARALESVAKSFPSTKDTADSSQRIDLPSPLLQALKRTTETLEAWLAKNEPTPLFDPVLEIYFQILDFQRAADRINPRYATTLSALESDRILEIHCLDAAPELRQTLDAGTSAVFFSATLSPARYFTPLLGGSPNDPWLRLASPFPEDALTLFIHDRIDTRYRARQASMGSVAASVKKLVDARPGNHLVFLPSYDYLDRLAETFEALVPEARVQRQTPDMDLEAREAFLDAFRSKTNSTRVGFATLGGVFGEGVDLVGDRLIAVTVVGVGFPRIGVERDLLRDYYEQAYGEGFAFAYQIPGMNRVIQAVGRLIRTPSDKGAALLIDTRFREDTYQRLLPAWWRPIWASERQARID